MRVFISLAAYDGCVVEVPDHITDPSDIVDYAYDHAKPVYIEDQVLSAYNEETGECIWEA